MQEFLFLQTEVKQTGTVSTEVEERMQCHNLQASRGEDEELDGSRNSL